MCMGVHVCVCVCVCACACMCVCVCVCMVCVYILCMMCVYMCLGKLRLDLRYVSHEAINLQLVHVFVLTVVIARVSVQSPIMASPLLWPRTSIRDS